MIATIGPESRLIDVTLGDLADYLRACGFVCEKKKDAAPVQGRAPKPELDGIKGLAAYLHISETTAGKYYRDGIFDGALVKIGPRTLRFDKELASVAVKKKKRKNDRP